MTLLKRRQRPGGQFQVSVLRLSTLFSDCSRELRLKVVMALNGSDWCGRIVGSRTMAKPDQQFFTIPPLNHNELYRYRLPNSYCSQPLEGVQLDQAKISARTAADSAIFKSSQGFKFPLMPYTKQAKGPLDDEGFAFLRCAMSIAFPLDSRTVALVDCHWLHVCDPNVQILHGVIVLDDDDLQDKIGTPLVLGNLNVQGCA